MSKSSAKDNIVSLKRITVGIKTLAVILIVNVLFRWSSGLYEVIYFRGIFQFVRVSHDFTLGLLPIATIYWLVPLYFLYFLYEYCGTVKAFLVGMVGALIWLVNLFYISWGFNYTQPSLYEQLGLERVTLDSTYITDTFEKQTELVVGLAADNQQIQLPIGLEYGQLENIIREVEEELLSEWGTPTIGRVRIRKLFGGALLHLRTSGIYIPHAIEGHIDGGLYEVQHPFTLAHEMAHGYGYTDESVCNFIAYLTCIRSPDLLIRYSGELAYWRYLVKYYRYYNPEKWETLYADLPQALADDLTQIRAHIDRYKDLMPKMRDVIYDSYLKSHGVKAGIKSYDEMIQLIASWRQPRD